MYVCMYVFMHVCGPVRAGGLVDELLIDVSGV